MVEQHTVDVSDARSTRVVGANLYGHVAEWSGAGGSGDAGALQASCKLALIFWVMERWFESSFAHPFDK